MARDDETVINDRRQIKRVPSTSLKVGIGGTASDIVIIQKGEVASDFESVTLQTTTNTKTWL